MRRTTLSMLALGMAVLLASCGGDDTPTGVPRPRVPTLAVSSSQIRTQIDALFPAGSLRQSAQDQFTNVERKLAEGDTRLAAKMAFTLVDYTLRRFKQRQLLDPGGPSVAPTTRGAVAALITALYTYVGEAAPTPGQLEDMLGAGVHIQVVDNTVHTVVQPPFGAAMDIPANAFPEPAIVVIELLPDAADPLPGIPLANQFGVFVDISTVPSFPQFNEPVRVALCMAEETHSLPYSRLRVGHGISPTATELLPQVAINDILTCDGEAPPPQLGAWTSPSGARDLLALGARAASRAASTTWSFFGPKSAFALHSGMGGVTLKASPFGIVDPGATGANTLLISPSPANVTVGGTQQLTTQLLNAAGAPVTPTGSATWTSARPSIATVSSTGLVTGVAIGTTVVAATLDGVTGFDTVNVTAPAPVGTTINGTVTDEIGNPVANAVVTLVGSTISATTATNGAYQLTVPGTAVTPNTLAEVRAQLPGYAAASDTITVIGGTFTRNLSIALVSSFAKFYDNFENGTLGAPPPANLPAVGTWTVTPGSGSISVEGGAGAKHVQIYTGGPSAAPPQLQAVAVASSPSSVDQYIISWKSSLTMGTVAGSAFAAIDVLDAAGARIASVVYDQTITPTTGPISFQGAGGPTTLTPTGATYTSGVADQFTLYIWAPAGSQGSYSLYRNGGSSPIASGNLFGTALSSAVAVQGLRLRVGGAAGQLVRWDDVRVTLEQIPQ